MSDIDQRILSDQYKDPHQEHLSAREAAELLGIKLPTLYAYASRGFVRSIPTGKGRARRYLRADLERLRARRDARAGHGPLAAGALRWGEPVLDTTITALSPAGPIYRGRPGLDLASADTPFESVAELLWTAALPERGAPESWLAHELPLPLAAVQRLIPDSLPPLPALAIVVPLLGSRDPGRFVPGREAVLPRARTLIRRMAAALAPGLAEAPCRAAFGAPDVASAVAAALDARHGADGVRAINRALVVAADHELNASAFAARVAASTGADPYACVAAALAAISGPRHGGAADRVEALISEIGEPGDAERVVHERARRGEVIEGFAHPLYPQGDPRGAMLVELARELEPRAPDVRTCLALVDAMQEVGAGTATIDVGLVALCAALGVRRGSAVGLFAVGRCAGWIAHAIEQYEAGYLLRPRARYQASAD